MSAPVSSAAAPPATPQRFRVIGKVSEIISAFKAKKAAAAALAKAARSAPAVVGPEVVPPPVPPATSHAVNPLPPTRVEELELAYLLERDAERRGDLYAQIKAARSQESESLDSLTAAYAQEADRDEKAQIFARIQIARAVERRKP